MIWAAFAPRSNRWRRARDGRSAVSWLVFAGSFAAVLALAGFARLLKLGGSQPLASGDEAVALAEALVSGFAGKAGVVAVARANAAPIAAATGGPGDLVVIEPLGARHRATRSPHARVIALAPGVEGMMLTLETAPGALLRLTVADDEAARAFATILGDG